MGAGRFGQGENRVPSTTDAEWLTRAQNLSWTRPLVPYPHWRFNADWENQQSNIPLRREIWEHFRDQGRFLPVDVPWHYETLLRVVLSNDVSQQLYIAGCLEPNEMAFVDTFLKPGMKAVDIGANEGCYSVLFAAKVGPLGKVWSFEPSPREFAILKSNSINNPALNISLFPLALGNKNRTVFLRVAEGVHAGQNTLGNFSYPINELDPVGVSMRRLDDLMLEENPDRIDLIKLDVEGAEALVLEGAQKTLEKYRPVVMMEVLETALAAMGSSTIRLLNQFRGWGYKVAFFDPGTAKPRLATDGTVLLSENILFFPEEMDVQPWIFG